MKLLVIILLLPFPLWAQVNVTTHIEMAGPDSARTIVGLSEPSENSSALTIGTAAQGKPHWAEATIFDQTIMLDQDVDPEEIGNGMILRFLVPFDLAGELNISLVNGSEYPLRRADGLAPRPGQLLSGGIAEIVFAEDKWIILAPMATGCPPNSMLIRPGLCMDAIPSGDEGIYTAISTCSAKGGKLCTWDEYYIGCTVLNVQLQGMHESWEWIDDNSNHTHTADQVGRYTCRSQRSANPVQSVGRTRCCYHPR